MTFAGSSNGRTGRSERLDVGSIPTPAAQTEVIRLEARPAADWEGGRRLGRGSNNAA